MFCYSFLFVCFERKKDRPDLDIKSSGLVNKLIAVSSFLKFLSDKTIFFLANSICL